MALNSCPCPPPENGMGCSCGDHYFVQQSGSPIDNISYASDHPRVLNYITEVNPNTTSTDTEIHVNLPSSEFILNDLITIYAKLTLVDGSSVILPFYAKLIPNNGSPKTIVIGPSL